MIYLEHPADGSRFLEAIADELGEVMPNPQHVVVDRDGKHESAEFFGFKVRWPKRT